MVGLELSDVILRFGQKFYSKYHPNTYQQRVLHALSVCRTHALGGHKYTCNCCGLEKTLYNSCRNRHCPKCQSLHQAIWIDDLVQATLRVKHYHLIFTVPHELNQIAMLDSRWFYDQLFACVWETIRQLGYTHFGVETGAVCVLHTWGQSMVLHPHIHCIVPAVGQTLAGNMKYIGSGGKFLFPERQLGSVFRGKLMHAIARKLKQMGMEGQYREPINLVWEKPWVVDCEPALTSPDHVIRYLGQYTHRVAITNQRIISINNTSVTFMHKDYRDNARQKPINLDGVEFLHRFCLHILPKGFVKIRHYGIYSSRAKALANKLNPVMAIIKKKKVPLADRAKQILGFDICQCPFCKKGVMQMVETLPRIRSPSSFYTLIANIRR